eukprot:6456430-Amphidinium_carterae.1
MAVRNATEVNFLSAMTKAAIGGLVEAFQTQKKPAALHKKPAAATTAVGMKRVAEEVVDEAVAPNETRVKRRFVERNHDKFSQNFKDAWKRCKGNSAVEKKLLACVQKQGRNYSLNEDEPFVEETIAEVIEKYMQASTKSLPKTLMMNQCGGQSGLETALANGEIVE